MAEPRTTQPQASPPPARASRVATVPWEIIEALPEPVILLDKARTVVSANHAAREIFGETMVGVDLARSVRHPAALEVADAVIAEEISRTADVTLASPVSQSFMLRAAGLTGDGSPGGVRAALFFYNVTEAKRVEQMRADFVANVSHELRSPLSSLVGFIETLKGAARNDEQARARFLDVMQREGERMTRLIDDLLSLSRVEVKEHVAPSSRVEVPAILGQVAELVAGAAAERNMTISVDAEPELSPVQGEPDELIQVFQNLMDNAIKYGREGSAVTVVAREIDSTQESGRREVEVSVTDDGEGIPREQIPRLTERFYRVDKARSRSLGGTGLGLAIVKHIVSRHRGRLRIESTEGKGSTFTVSLRVPRIP
jgi:two-component system phosphate regulon sensor histidine kinase PhoR